MTTSPRSRPLLQALLALAAFLLLLAWLVPLQNPPLTVTFTEEGAVIVSPDGTVRPLEAGTQVQEGDVVRVPDGAAATLEAPDGHGLILTDSSELRVEEHGRTLLRGGGTEVAVPHGTLQVTGEGGARTSLQVSTPNGVAAVRGTRFRLEVGGSRSLLSLHDGAVAVEAAGERVELSPGSGAVFTDQGTDLRDLPGTPEHRLPAPGARIGTAGTPVVWTSVPGADGYLLELGGDSLFHQHLARVRVEDTTTALPDHPVDRPVHLRISALTSEGLAGIPTEPRRVELRVRLEEGLARRSAGELDASVEALRAATAHFDQDAGALAELGWSLYLADRLTEAREAYDRATAQEPDDLDVYLEKGRVLFWLESYGEAEAAYRHVLDREPDTPDALWGLADVYRVTGRTEEARELLLRVLELAPEHPYAAETLRRLESGP